MSAESAEEIQKHLSSAFGQGLSGPDSPAEDECEKMVPQLVQEFHQDSVFQTNEKGELAISLEEQSVVDAARRLIAESQNS